MRYTPAITARLCYSRGWRDKNLITIVAIVGAETNYETEFSDGSKVGLFGLHPESLEPAVMARYYDAEFSAKQARERYERRHFAPWISYATGKYYNFIEEAIAGVSELYLSFFKEELRG